MKSFLPLLSITIFFSACSAAYKSGQTPDDVYFSPQRAQEEYVSVEDRDDKYYRNERNQGSDRNDYYNYDDSYLRMKVRNRQRWSNMDYDNYSYNPYYYRNYNNYYYNSPFNSYSYWDYYYNPYASRVIVVNPKSPAYNKPRTMNLRVFDQNVLNSTPVDESHRSTNVNSGSNNSRNTSPRRDFGNDLRKVFGSGNDNSNSTPRSSAPTYNSGSSNNSSSNTSSSNSNSSSGGSGGSAPARRF